MIDAEKMKVTTVALPKQFLNILAEMKKEGIIKSSSDYIRMALLEKFNKDLETLKVIYK